jgi:septum formation protein
VPSALILASASPRRRELLERVGVPIEVRPADVDETPLPGEAPRAYVVRVAAAKASAAAVRGRFVLAADTTVTVGGAILGKAADAADAAAMLRALSGRVHEVVTAFAIVGPRSASGVVATEVDVIALDDRAIADYAASGEWRGKAGAYAIQGIAAAFVRGVRGSVTNVIGLPLVEVLAALRDVGAPGAALANGAPA